MARPMSCGTTSSPLPAITSFSAPAPSRTCSFSFQTNIVYFDSGALLTGDWSGSQFAMDWNLYFDARPDARPARSASAR